MWCFVDRSNPNLVAMVTVTVAERILFVVNKFRHMLEAWWSSFPASLMLLSLHKIKELQLKNSQPRSEMKKWEPVLDNRFLCIRECSGRYIHVHQTGPPPPEGLLCVTSPQNVPGNERKPRTPGESWHQLQCWGNALTE